MALLLTLPRFQPQPAKIICSHCKVLIDRGEKHATIRYVFDHTSVVAGDPCYARILCRACFASAGPTVRTCRGCLRPFGHERIMIAASAASEPGDRLLANMLPQLAGYYHPRCLMMCVFCRSAQARAIPREYGGEASADIIDIQDSLFYKVARPGKQDVHVCSVCAACAERCSFCGGLIVDEADMGSGIHAGCKPSIRDRVTAEFALLRPCETVEFKIGLMLDYKHLLTLPAQ